MSVRPTEDVFGAFICYRGLQSEAETLRIPVRLATMRGARATSPSPRFGVRNLTGLWTCFFVQTPMYKRAAPEVRFGAALFGMFVTFIIWMGLPADTGSRGITAAGFFAQVLDSLCSLGFNRVRSCLILKERVSSPKETKTIRTNQNRPKKQPYGRGYGEIEHGAASDAESRANEKA